MFKIAWKVKKYNDIKKVIKLEEQDISSAETFYIQISLRGKENTMMLSKK